ncbi:MAG: hypothetical protein QGD94_02320 [Planctomycetia bacterium]|nr:hypothetical protein [Planctomycetia bacterium]
MRSDPAIGDFEQSIAPRHRSNSTSDVLRPAQGGLSSTLRLRPEGSPSKAEDTAFAGGFRQIDIDEPGPRRGISVRSVLLGLLFIVCISIIEPYSRIFKGNTPLIGNNFPMVVIFLLILLVVCVNPILRVLTRRSHFSSSELLVIFGLTYTACCVPGQGIVRCWLTELTGGFFYTNQYPEWQGIFSSLPDWLFPSRDPDSMVIQGFWRGLGEDTDISWQTWQHLASAWAVPFLTWGLFFLAVFVCLWCIAVLVRRQWVESEKLDFPLARIVLEIMRPPAKGRLLNSLFRDRLLWVGALIVFSIHMLGALHHWFPNIPAIPVAYNHTQLFSNFPWNSLGWYVQTSQVYFTAIGIMYFVTTRCSFSLWFFAVALAVWYLVAASMGIPVGALYDKGPWRYQFFGAMLVLMVSLAWVSRAHLMLILRSLVGRYKTPKGSEYMSYRCAATLLIVSFAVAVCWLWLAGMAVLHAIIMLAVLLMIFLTMARIVAETGLFMFHSDFKPLSATEYFVEFSTTPPISHNTYLIGAMVSRQYWGTKENLLPYAVNTVRTADGVRHIGRRWLIPIFIVGIMLAFAVSAMTWGWLGYTRGALMFSDTMAAGTADRLQEDMNNTLQFARPLAGVKLYSPLWYTAVGAAIMAALALARYRWARWPLYPVGWLLCASWAIHALWFSIFLGWMAKSLILKFGGADLYNRLKPLFLGLLVGEVTASAVVCAVPLIFGMPVPPNTIMPG